MSPDSQSYLLPCTITSSRWHTTLGHITSVSRGTHRHIYGPQFGTPTHRACVQRTRVREWLYLTWSVASPWDALCSFWGERGWFAQGWFTLFLSSSQCQPWASLLWHTALLPWIPSSPSSCTSLSTPVVLHCAIGDPTTVVFGIMLESPCVPHNGQGFCLPSCRHSTAQSCGSGHLCTAVQHTEGCTWSCPFFSMAHKRNQLFYKTLIRN
jgi:hypothetical protein